MLRHISTMGEVVDVINAAIARAQKVETSPAPASEKSVSEPTTVESVPHPIPVEVKEEMHTSESTTTKEETTVKIQ